MSQIVFPLWFVADPVTAAPSLLAPIHHEGVKAVPLFTDGNLARAFRAAKPSLAHHGFSCLAGKQDLAALLQSLEQIGILHVIIDPGSFDARPITLGQAWKAGRA